MNRAVLVSLALGLTLATSAPAQQTGQVPYTVRAFNPAHADLPRSAGMPARLANEEYVEALARIVYYWAYPAIDVTSRTTMWELMKEGPGLMFGIGPGSPVNESGCLSGYLPPTQRIVVTPNMTRSTAWPSSIWAGNRSSSRRRPTCPKVTTG
jgi:hypothetical protein